MGAECRAGIRACRMKDVDTGPAVEVRCTGQFGMTGDIEVSAAARRSNLSEDTDPESVKKLLGLLDVAAVARVNIDNRYVAAGSGHDRPTRSPLGELVLVVVCAELVAITCWIPELFSRFWFAGD